VYIYSCSIPVTNLVLVQFKFQFLGAFFIPVPIAVSL